MSEPSSEGFKIAETQRRNSFDHKIDYDLGLTNPDTLKRVKEEIKILNGDGSGRENFIFSITENEEGNSALQMWEKNIDPNQSNIQVLELDLIGGEKKQIRTNDLQKSLDAAEKFRKDAVLHGDKIQILKIAFGRDLRKTLQTEIRNETNKTLPVLVQTEPKVEEKVLKGEKPIELSGAGKAIVLVENPTLPNDDPGSAIELVKPPVEIALPADGKIELHKGDQSIDKKNEIVRVSTHERTDLPPKQKKSLHFGVAAAVGSHKVETTIINAAGKEVTVTRQSKEVLMQAAERFASSQLSEVAAKREEGFLPTVKTYVERFWRGTLTKGIHEKKEKFHGIEIMAAAGVETGITAEFNAEIDRRAREKIDAERSKKKGGKFLGALRDFGNEFLGRERDLHREKVLITAELRAQYIVDPSDDKNPIHSLLQRDSLVREALAENIMTSPVDFLHAGDQKTAEFKVDSDSIFGKFLREEVLLKIKDDVITESKKPGYNNKISGKLRTQLDQNIQDFFFSDKFQEYRKTLPVEDQKRFENSLTYATNILSQAETSFIPLVREKADFMSTAAATEMDIFLTLGTAQLGPKGEIKAPSVFDKDRISNNQALFDRLREVRRKSKNHNAAGMYGDAELNAGLKRDLILAAAHSVATSEILWAGAGALGGRFIMTAARGSISWIPLVGAGLAGTVAGVKEFSNSTEIRGQWMVEGAEGYEHPTGANATRSEAMRRLDYYRIDLGHRVQQLDFSIGELSKANPPTEAQILQTIAYMADSEARIRLGDKGGYSLFTASKDSAGERGIFQAQETIHNKSRSLALTKLQALLDGDDHKDLRGKIATAMGADPAKMVDSANLIHTLAKSQETHLHDGTKVSKEFMTVMGMDPKLVIEQEQSIQARDEAFNKYRWMQGFKNGAFTGAMAGLFALGSTYYQDIHKDISALGFEKGPIKLLDHNLPTQVSALPGGANAILDPNTNELVGATFTHIPQGTYWVEDATKPGAFDLMLQGDEARIPLLNDVTFNENHEINLTPSVLADLETYKLDISVVAQDPISWQVEGSAETIDQLTSHTAWDGTIRYADLPGGSLDAYYNQNLHETFAANPPLDAEGNPIVIPYNGITNSLRYLTRSVQLHEYPDGSNVQFADGVAHELNTVTTVNGTEFISAAQSPTLELTKMPDYLIGPEGNRKVADLVIEAIAQKHAGLNFSDEAHRIAWEISERATEGDVPKADELEIISAYLQKESTTITPAPEMHVETYTPYDTIITATQDIVVEGQVASDALASSDVFNQAVAVLPDTLTFWNPASLIVPALGGAGYYHALEAVEVKRTNSAIGNTPITQQPSPALPGPVTPPKPGSTPPVTNPLNVNPGSPELALAEINVNVDDFRGVAGAELVSMIEKRPEAISAIEANRGNFESVKNISSFMNEIANKHNLPVAYIVRDGRVRLLTRAPEIVEDNKSRVFYYNPETGKEETLEMLYSTKQIGPVSERLNHTVIFNDKANFPTLTTPIDRPIADHRTVQAYLKEAGYDLSGYQFPEAKPFNPASTTLWQNDIIEAVAFLEAVKAAKKAAPPTPTPPEAPPTDVVDEAKPTTEEVASTIPVNPEIKIDSTPEEKEGKGGIGTELPKVFAEAERSDPSKIVEIMHDQAYKSFIPKLRAELAPKHQEREDWQKMPEKAWVFSQDILDTADKYDIPIAFMRRVMHGGDHYIVLVEPPKRMADGDYTIRYYDPKADGIHTEVVNLDRRPDEYAEIHLSHAAVAGEVSNDIPIGEGAMILLQNANYNLEIDDRQREWKKAVEAKSQVGPNNEGDGENCGPLILLYAARARALKVDKKNAQAKAKIRAFDKVYGIETPISEKTPF